MRTIITVMGVDKAGIIAKVSGCLYQYGVNILDINQTIMQDIFTMIMMADLKNAKATEAEIKNALETIGNEIGVDIRMQNEDIFNSMHRI